MIKVEEIGGKTYLVAKDYCQEITPENCHELNLELYVAGKNIRQKFFNDEK